MNQGVPEGINFDDIEILKLLILHKFFNKTPIFSKFAFY